MDLVLCFRDVVDFGDFSPFSNGGLLTATSHHNQGNDNDAGY